MRITRYVHESRHAQGINFVNNKIYVPSYKYKYKYLPAEKIGYRGDKFWSDNSHDMDKTVVMTFYQYKVQIFDMSLNFVEEVRFNDENFIFGEGSVGFGNHNFEYVEKGWSLDMIGFFVVETMIMMGILNISSMHTLDILKKIQIILFVEVK